MAAAPIDCRRRIGEHPFDINLEHTVAGSRQFLLGNVRQMDSKLASGNAVIAPIQSMGDIIFRVCQQNGNIGHLREARTPRESDRPVRCWLWGTERSRELP